jgi:ribosome biogenesis GTPase A
MHYSITTVEEKLNLAAEEIKKCLAFDILDSDTATHVVTEISWGAQCVITAKSQIAVLQDRDQIAGELEAQLGLLKIIGLGNKGALGLSKESSEKKAEYSFEVTVCGDVLANDGLVPTDFESTQKFISNVPKYIATANSGKGKPITYTLMPLSTLKMFHILEIKSDVIIRQIRTNCLEEFVQLFDDLRDAQQNLHDYNTQIRSHPSAIPPAHLEIVQDHLDRARMTEASLKSDYARALTDVRAGKDGGDEQQLWQLLGKYRDGESSAKNLQSVATYVEKMEFVGLITREGAQYVGYQNSSVDNIIVGNPYDDAYILYFNDQLRHESSSWNDNFTLLLELLRDTAQKKLVIAVDCDAVGKPLEKPYICQTRNSRVIVEDVVEQRKILASECIMRYNENVIDRSLSSKPLTRRAVKIPCPQSYCDRTLRCAWICSICQCIVEFGHVDDYLYCNCGACRYDQWEFKCKDPRHGSAWGKYNNAALLTLLKELEAFEELNILILGETGVGKSTWINAFINYLTYDSLYEAMQSETSRCVIPCSFTTQISDKSDSRGKLVQKKISIGSSRSERDGSAGQSATQETSVYPFDIGSTRVRLIDTPGIGDTGGVDQDNKNMADILRVLRNYSKLHGILILLKPNAPRLTVMFRFCIKQLLTHLHRNAANNIVFGFTNTRGSNYMPGDTFKPLEALLEEYMEVGIGLYKHNVYCFDSESFRYLAARKQGVDMGLLEDNARSWEYSVEECQRLVKHFQGLKPHEVRSTLNLNETRSIILRMAEPMAVIAQAITASIEVNNDQVKELQKQQFTREQLEQKLFVEKKSMESFPVDDPRTVCTHHSCVEVRSDFEGRQETAVIYKTMCHRPCGLSGVDKNKKGHPDLQYCSAINRNTGLCKQCNHSWMDHMHIYYEYRPITYQYRNEDVNKDLMKNASDIELQEEAIGMKKTAIAEYEIEHGMVQEAGIRFGFFLKRHAITPYNDATLEYLDHLIDQEKMKVQNGGTKKALDDLEKYKREHIQKVDTLQKAMDRGDSGDVLDDKGVRQLIDTLYGLPHFGKDLKKIVTTNEKAAEATYRERSTNVSAGARWNPQSTGKRKQTKSRQNYNHSHQANQASIYYSDSHTSDSYSDTIPGSFPGPFPWSSPSEHATAVPGTYQIPLRPDQQTSADRYKPDSGSHPNSKIRAFAKSIISWIW